VRVYVYIRTTKEDNSKGVGMDSRDNPTRPPGGSRSNLLLRGMSTDGRYQITQNGLSGFLDKRGKSKNREYQEGIVVQDMGVSIRTTTMRDMFSGSSSTATQDLFHSTATAARTNDLMALATTNNNDNNGDREGGDHRRRLRRDDENASGNGYTRGDKRRGNKVMLDQLLDEPEEGVITFRVDAKKRKGDDDILEIFEGDTIMVEANGRVNVLDIETVTYGQEALVNERTRAVSKTNRSNVPRKWKRSRALYTAYVTARVSEKI
jgi:hypothetical protein